MTIYYIVVISYLKAQKTGSKHFQFLNSTPEKRQGNISYSYDSVCDIWFCCVCQYKSLSLNQKYDDKFSLYHLWILNQDLKSAVLWNGDKNIFIPGTELCWS